MSRFSGPQATGAKAARKREARAEAEARALVSLVHAEGDSYEAEANAADEEAKK